MQLLDLRLTRLVGLRRLAFEDPGQALYAWRFQVVIRFGCSPCLLASSAIVCSPCNASYATVALNKPRRELVARRLVFIDETWAKTNMTRTHGRCARGTRLVAKVPHRRWRTLTFLAALGCRSGASGTGFEPMRARRSWR